ATKLDDEGRKLLEVLIDYRDVDASRVLAVRDGERARAREATLSVALANMTREAAARTCSTGYYCGVSEGMAKEVIKVVGIGMALGKAMDFGAGYFDNPTLEFWKPTVLGGWDDILGGWVNVREMLDVADKFKDAEIRRKRRRGAKIDGALAIGFGAGSSVLLGAVAIPWLDHQTLGEALIAPGSDALARHIAAPAYGVASSGATAALSVLPARHYYGPIKNLVENGVIPTPKGFESGAAHEAWVAFNSVRAHLAYTAQLGGAAGVVTSGLFMLGTAWTFGLGSAIIANLVMSIGGAFETVTTGAFLLGRRWRDDGRLAGMMRDELKALEAREGPSLRGFTS
ncbi:MAG: hypothetical protein AAF658_07350, partial [Myxococcota bacterium]